MYIHGKYSLAIFHLAVIVLFVGLSFRPVNASQIDIVGPAGSGAFGTIVIILANGNIVVTDPTFDLSAPTVDDAGAVYMYNGLTGALISVMTGSKSNDRVGNNGIIALANGNYVVVSASWDGAVADVGAVTMCSGTTGCTGVVTSANSLTGSTPGDNVGGAGAVALVNGNFIVRTTNWDGAAMNVGSLTWCSGTTGCAGMVVSAANSLVGSSPEDNVGSNFSTLTNGDYLARTSGWDSATKSNVGAVTLCSGVTGCAGVISPANSLVGSNNADSVGSNGVTELVNGNFVVKSNSWGGEPIDAGAATWCSGTTGCVGEVSSANSLIGSAANERIGDEVTPLIGGNYVVWSPTWNSARGAATWCSGNTGCSGEISPVNSLVGSTPNDNVGGGVTQLSNGNYVVQSGNWDGTAPDIGAVTWCSGASGCVGAVSAANSLVGSTTGDQVGGVRAVGNGNYVVVSSVWNGAAPLVGAVTWCNGATGCSGTVSASNSLVGSTDSDRVGSGGVTVLTNGNYVVASLNWDGAVANVGAATWCDGSAGCVGAVSSANSLVGSTLFDRVALRGVTALTNGNYVVSSPGWAGTAPVTGAVTLCSGSTGCVGPVTAANSLVGARENDAIGDDGVTALVNGNYLVVSEDWDAAAADVGAMTLCKGTAGCAGMVVSETNSLVGSRPSDRVGSDGITPLPDGGYIALSNFWDNPAGPINNAEAVSYGRADGGTVGIVGADNSVRGTTTDGIGGFSFNPTHNRLVVRRPRSDIVTVFKSFSPKKQFDYDGDGKTDISVFRPANGAWYLNQSTAGFFGIQFGFGTDKIAPADYDGDGKTDIAVYRPAEGQWYIVNSSSGVAEYRIFGLAEDLPAPADYDGDGKADICVFRPSTGTWYLQRSSNGSFFGIQFGSDGDRPTVGDFDGDGKSDIGIWRPSNGDWYHIRSSDGTVFGERFGISTDKMIPADYDGDGETDLAVWRPSSGVWYIKQSSNGAYVSFLFGLPADIPAPGDFDGDGKADRSVFRESHGTWYITNSTNGSFTILPWGQSGDRPTPAAFLN